MNTSEPPSIPMQQRVAQVTACIEVIRAICDCIKDCTLKSSLRGIPSGELYAQVMSYLTYDQYTAIISKLKELGIVREFNHLLTWVAPIDKKQ
jgi:hypothetical protein